MGTLNQAVEVARQIESASVLSGIASALAKAGGFRQAVEVAQQIEDASFKAIALSKIAMTLATKLNREVPNGPVVMRMKNSFTPKEKQLARQLVEAT